MGNKGLRSRYRLLIFSMYMTFSTLIIMGCNHIEKGGTEGWSYDTLFIDTNCSMYIEYAKGKYFMNISTMDSCSALNSEAYIEGYKKLLENFSQKLNTQKGIATFLTSFNFINNEL